MATELDYMENYTNDGLAQAAYVSSDASYIPQYPPAHNDTYVKATSKIDTGYWPYYATDPAKSLTGTQVANAWMANAATNQRFHIDLGSAKIIKRIYYENTHHIGVETDMGSKNFILQGSNDAGDFADLVYANDGSWVIIESGLQFDQHIAANQADPKYILIDSDTAYRYYAIKIADNWGDPSYLGLRHIALQTVVLQCYSEDTIKEQGTYSLKAFAKGTDALNETLTRAVDPTIDLSGLSEIKLDIRASRTGSHIKIGIHDSGGTTTEHTANIAEVDTFQTETWDISGVADGNKDAIDSIIITIDNADADNTFYFDNIYGQVVAVVANAVFFGANF